MGDNTDNHCGPTRSVSAAVALFSRPERIESLALAGPACLFFAGERKHGRRLILNHNAKTEGMGSGGSISTFSDFLRTCVSRWYAHASRTAMPVAFA